MTLDDIRNASKPPADSLYANQSLDWTCEDAGCRDAAAYLLVCDAGILGLIDWLSCKKCVVRRVGVSFVQSVHRLPLPAREVEATSEAGVQ